MSDIIEDRSIMQTAAQVTHFFLGPILTLCGTHEPGQLLTRMKERVTCPICMARMPIFELSFSNYIVRHVCERFGMKHATWEEAMQAAVLGLAERDDRVQKEVLQNES